MNDTLKIIEDLIAHNNQVDDEIKDELNLITREIHEFKGNMERKFNLIWNKLIIRADHVRQIQRKAEDEQTRLDAWVSRKEEEQKKEADKFRLEAI